MYRKNVVSSDPIFGIIDDVADKLGVWRAEEFLPSPVELVEQAGLPKMKDIIPSPYEVGEVISQALPKLPVIEHPPTKRLAMAPAEMLPRLN